MGALLSIGVGLIIGALVGAVIETIDEVTLDPEPTFWLGLLHAPTMVIGGIVAALGLVLFGVGSINVSGMLMMLFAWPGALIGAFVWSYIFVGLEWLASQ